MAAKKQKGDSNKSTKIIYCKYIVKNGKRIYPKNANVFRFEVKA